MPILLKLMTYDLIGSRYEGEREQPNYQSRSCLLHYSKKWRMPVD